MRHILKLFKRSVFFSPLLNIHTILSTEYGLHNLGQMNSDQNIHNISKLFKKNFTCNSI